MPILNRMSIGQKLACASSLAILLVFAITVAQFINAYRVDAALEISGREKSLLFMTSELTGAALGMQVGAKDIRLSRNDAENKSADDLIQSRLAASLKSIDTMRLLSTDVTLLDRLQRVKSDFERYSVVAREMLAVKAAIFAIRAKAVNGEVNSADAARVATLSETVDTISSTKTQPIRRDYLKTLDEIKAAATLRSAASDAEATSIASAGKQLAVGLSFLTIIVLFATAVFGAVSIAAPLRALAKPLGELAEGNFSVVIPGMSRKDEVGQIAVAVAEMVKQVRSVIGSIKSSAREVTNASAEISTSTTDLSQRTEEQAASLEETSASMEEIASTVKNNAENARKASDSAANTQKVADRGGEVVAQAVQAMAKIEESSRKISDIIGVIDEIARQTNLLALNAAVEAARAGEAGRGFAVVASEVRSLAQRSSQAAKDIKGLITNSNSQGIDGVELVNRAGAALGEIVESIKSVAYIISDIANASNEQSTGIEQINKALTQMDEVTQQNSALVEENAATAKALENQAKDMGEQVEFFRVDNAGDGREPAKRRQQDHGHEQRRPVARASRQSEAA